MALSALPNRLGRSRSEEGDHWVFRFANGLVVHTDPFLRASGDRVLPLGGPQDTILNRLLCFPELVRDRSVFEPFAGAGALGLMALKLGARRVELLDVNPRACAFQQENADRNGFAADRVRSRLGSIVDSEVGAPFDLVLANPPFVPTPPGIPGTLTSSGGPEGSDLVSVLFRRLDGLLAPDGEAYVYVMQLCSSEGPLIAPFACGALANRTLTFTPTQEAPIPFADFAWAYRRCFSQHEGAIARWQSDLTARHGEGLGIEHFVVRVSPQRPGPTRWVITHDLNETYGVPLYPVSANGELALGRVMENVVPSAP